MNTSPRRALGLLLLSLLLWWPLVACETAETGATPTVQPSPTVEATITPAFTVTVEPTATPEPTNTPDTPTMPPTPEPTATEPPALDEDALANATYEIADLGVFTLQDGNYEESYGEGAAQVHRVHLVTTAFGDLNEDTWTDGVAVLGWNSGGSGTFMHLAAMANQQGTPEQIAITLLGDRVRVEEITVTEGEITLQMVTHGPDDPLCCPSKRVETTYALREGVLVVTETQTVRGPGTTGGAGQAEIVGQTWYWLAYQDTAGLNDLQLDEPSRYTLTLNDDSTFQVKADCNTGRGAYTLEDNSLMLEVQALTRAVCPPDSHSQTYLDRLDDIATYVLKDGRLYLNLIMDAGNMVFGPQPSRSVGQPGDGAPDEVLGTTWQWQAYRDLTGKEASFEVEEPGRYTLTLSDDGSFGLEADCNVGTGGYTLGDGQLTLQVRAMTEAYCIESRHDQYLAFLDKVVSYELEDGELILRLARDRGEMILAPKPTAAETLAGTWAWVQTTEPDGGRLLVGDPSRYTVTVEPDGNVAITADCNLAAASLAGEDGGNSLALDPTALAECGPGSLYSKYLAQLGAVQGYRLEGETLRLILTDGSRMVFEAVE